jgi:hypothetical protein
LVAIDTAEWDAIVCDLIPRLQNLAMRLVDEIVELASDGKKPLADALRKCLILAAWRQAKNAVAADSRGASRGVRRDSAPR